MNWNREQGFQDALEYTFGVEGGFSDDPVDRGGKTLWGITQKTWDSWRKATGTAPRPLSEMKMEDAKDIYREWYWEANRCHEIRSKRVAIEVFEATVNCGLAGAGKIVQKTVNLLDTDKADLLVDGVLGPRTIAALNVLASSYELSVLGTLNVYQGIHYIGIQDRNESQKKFIRGWMKRCVPEGEKP
jgi:lysozyme family protein